MRAITLTILTLASLAPIGAALAQSPQAATWRSIKSNLTGENWMEFYEHIRDVLLPKLSGTVVSVLENEGVSKVTVALSDSVTPR